MAIHWLCMSVIFVNACTQDDTMLSNPLIQHKIVYVFLDFFPPEAHRDGWIADALHRNFIGTAVFKSGRITGLIESDLFILNDADELPTGEAVAFLRWHDGYPQPVLLKYL